MVLHGAPEISMYGNRALLPDSVFAFLTTISSLSKSTRDHFNMRFIAPHARRGQRHDELVDRLGQVRRGCRRDQPLGFRLQRLSHVMLSRAF
jgi:hypothetical protein